MEAKGKLPLRIKFAMAYGDFGKSTLNFECLFPAVVLH